VLIGMASLGESSVSAVLILHPQSILELTDIVGVGGVHRLAGESLNILSGSAGDAGECPPAMAEVVCDAEWG
jgi:pseudouridine-5'-phosphate glycosidase